MNPKFLLLAMLFVPLGTSALNGLVIRTKKTRKAGTLATLASGTSFVCAFLLFLTVRATEAPVNVSFEWFTAGATTVRWGFAFDALTAMMALVVTGIGTVIHLYSIGYLSDDPSPSRYFAYLNLFLFNMLTLITADNLAVLFVGWEGVGLCSYLLIGYWYKDLEKANAGMKAFLVNRIGDAGFLIGLFLCLKVFGTANFQQIKTIIYEPGFSGSVDILLINLIALFLFIGATGKSAQIPLYVWLPDAMAGPTPVSALIHAATMVTAGIYLISRMSPLFVSAIETNALIAWTGAVTALFAATIALAQRDIKKVLAYSTVSQLGLMFLALGTRNYFGALFHLMTHAFFKALLFLGAGSVIHALSGEQDAFQMGGLKKKLPFTHITFLIGTIAIAGIPPLAGFFSKDLILYGALMDEKRGLLLWVLGSAASLLTAFYMTRLYSLIFLGEYRGHAHPHESPSVMTIPLILLALGSVAAGFLGVPHAFHMLPNFLDEFLGNTIAEWQELPTMISEFGAMGIAVALGVLGMGAGFALYSKGPQKVAGLAKGLKPLQVALLNKYWIDELYGLLIVLPFEKVSRFLARFVDPRIIDGAVLLPTRVCRAGGTFLSMVQNGAAQFYLFVMLLGTLVILWLSLKGMVI